MRIVMEWHDRYFDEMKQHSVVCLAGMWYNKGNAGSYIGENEMKTIHEIVRKQRDFFVGGKTMDINFRKSMLLKLKEAILCNQGKIEAALYADLGKSKTESYMCEIGLVLSELSYQAAHIKKLTAAKRRKTPLANFHAKSFIVQEPYGCVLIMSPWNYPFLLCLQPLAGAIAAGNCAVIKPSAYSPATSHIIKEIISEVFEEGFVSVVEGGRQENSLLLEEKFDYIFFTGGIYVGKQVMEKASQNLTPVTLELGGKSPCIVDRDCDIKRAARRIAFGKYLNCGQTCVAPDYLLIHQDVKEVFLKELFAQVRSMYSDEPLENPAYGKMINEKHFNRVLGLIDESKVVFGGRFDRERLKIAPTVMDGVTREDAVMQEEIFGPVLPVIEVGSMEEAAAFVRQGQKPLALYIFTNNEESEQLFTERVSFGGGCVNDTVMHLSNANLPFGGVGASGMGAYHGAKTFETFSHAKSILKTSNWIDLPLRYQPYSRLCDKLIRRFLK